jgi:hypothetical protein
MRLIVASLVALSLLGAGAANAGGIGVGAHIGHLQLGVGMHGDGGHRHCGSWSHHHCRHWRR